MADGQDVRSFGGSRRGVKPPADEFPDRVVLPAMVLKPVELPVVLTVDRDVLEETVKAVYDAFHEAAKAGMAAAIAELHNEMAAADAAADAGEAGSAEPGNTATTA